MPVVEHGPRLSCCDTGQAVDPERPGQHGHLDEWRPVIQERSTGGAQTRTRPSNAGFSGRTRDAAEGESSAGLTALQGGEIAAWLSGFWGGYPGEKLQKMGFQSARGMGA